MKAFGFETGGLIVNVIITILAFLFFVDFLRKRFGFNAATVGMWLITTFPGIFYFSGMPYSYSTIVPSTLVILVLLWKSWESDNTLLLMTVAFVIGVLSTSYDFLPIFGFAYIVLLLLKRRYLSLLPATILLVLPSIIVALVLKFYYKVDLHNANTDMYSNMLSGFRGNLNYGEWFKFICNYPVVLFDNFFSCGFLFLPALFVFIVLANLRFKLISFGMVEIVMIAIVGAIHAVNNLVPPYGGWSLRGIGMARLYEPIVLVELLFVARYYQCLLDLGNEERMKFYFMAQMTALVAVVILNLAVVLGGVIGNPMTPYVYHRFYRHSSIECWEKNIGLYGKRLYGFHRLGKMCRVDLEDSASMEDARRILSRRRHK
jgi:hypothetical protein